MKPASVDFVFPDPFASARDSLAFCLNQSIPFDCRICEEDRSSHLCVGLAGIWGCHAMEMLYCGVVLRVGQITTDCVIELLALATVELPRPGAVANVRANRMCSICVAVGHAAESLSFTWTWSVPSPADPLLCPIQMSLSKCVNRSHLLLYASLAHWRRLQPRRVQTSVNHSVAPDTFR